MSHAPLARNGAVVVVVGHRVCGRTFAARSRVASTNAASGSLPSNAMPQSLSRVSLHTQLHDVLARRDCDRAEFCGAIRGVSC
jgi:hypothetical protein